jgi:hypothetical protein
MNGLKELRLGCGFKTIKKLCAKIEERGATMCARRYGKIEGGVVLADSEEIKVICVALGVSADLLLFGGFGGVNMRNLTEPEREIVASVARQLIDMRD